MYNNKSILAIIPARSGSKGLPNKNILQLCNKPLIAWSIESALKSSFIDKIIVSTDSERIASISKKWGAEVPFIRSKQLATDTATTFSVLENVINYYQGIQEQYDYIVLLEPTSPLRETLDIDNAIKILLKSQADAIVGISKTESQHPAFLINKDKNNYISGYQNKDMRVLRRQDIDDVFFFEGTIYISKTDTLLKRKTFYHDNTLGYEVPKYKSLEIDDLHDFLMVEAIMKHEGYN